MWAGKQDPTVHSGTQQSQAFQYYVGMGSVIEALYGPETEVPDHDQKLRVPLVIAAAWTRHLMAEDEQKASFDELFEISETFRLQVLNHINFGNSTEATQG